MNWKSVKNPPKENCGWFAVSIMPDNHDELSTKDINGWMKIYGFRVAWYNEDSITKWYLSLGGSNDTIPLNDRVIYWKELPKAKLKSTKEEPDTTSNDSTESKAIAEEKEEEDKELTEQQIATILAWGEAYEEFFEFEVHDKKLFSKLQSGEYTPERDTPPLSDESPGKKKVIE